MTASRAFTEAELLEIEQRFRHLVKAIEAADLILGACEYRHRERITKTEADLSIEGQYASTCRIIASHERNLDHVVEVRAGLERACEICRDDLRALVDRERGR